MKVEFNWLDDENPKYQKLRALREVTAGCPCDRCAGWQACKTTGHECAGFKRWVKTGKTKRN